MKFGWETFGNPGVVGEAECFDLILGSPPYFPPGSGTEGDHPQKMACRFELRGTVADYCARASRHLNPGGSFVCVFPVSPEQQHERLRQGVQESGLVVWKWRPVVFREGERPLLGLFCMMRKEDLPESLRGTPWREEPLVIRREDGTVHPEYVRVKMSFGFPP
ncbi:MAG: hypothetical protein HC904_05890 [Blastochloris sp.]|nr:hypothetical protein [Blastochloris sp.]